MDMEELNKELKQQYDSQWYSTQIKKLENEYLKETIKEEYFKNNKKDNEPRLFYGLTGGLFLFLAVLSIFVIIYFLK